MNSFILFTHNSRITALADKLLYILSDNIPLVLILEDLCKHRDLIIVINKSIQHRH